MEKKKTNQNKKRNKDFQLGVIKGPVTMARIGHIVTNSLPTWICQWLNREHLKNPVDCNTQK
jgi:hypothetical protein